MDEQTKNYRKAQFEKAGTEYSIFKTMIKFIKIKINKRGKI